MGKNGTKFRSDVVLGDRYRDSVTGYEGVASALYFFLNACERVNLERLDEKGEPSSATFDAPRLVHVDTGRTPIVDRTGGWQPEPGPR